MNDKKKLSNLINAKYKKLFLVGVLLLAVFLVFTMLKQADRPGLEPYPISKSSGDRLCIENIWSERNNIAFTVRNCGNADVNKDDFAKTLYYINYIKRGCASNITGYFNINKTQNVMCPINMKEICATECNISVQLFTITGKSDQKVFQYIPK